MNVRGLTGIRHTVVESAVGPLTLVATDGVLSGLFMETQARRPPPTVFGERDATPFPNIIEQLREYFAGDRIHFDVELAARGTPFQRCVWDALGAIPYGTTASYGQIADRIGRPGAFRAVGLANGANPISIIVPCHRVIGASGNLTGYGGGLDRKRLLLDLERARTVPTLL